MKFMSTSIAGEIALAVVALPVRAANVSTPQAVQIATIEGLRSPSKGYFVIRTASAVSGCEAGFWLPASDSRHSGYLARVNDALANNLPVIVAGDRDQLWPGSTESVCRITQLQ